MHEQLEMEWKEDKAKANSTTSAIPCKVYIPNFAMMYFQLLVFNLTKTGQRAPRQ
jgi:hypothetical protein